MISDSEVYPIDTIIRLKDTGEFARITGHNWLRPETNQHFLNYYAIIESKEGVFAIYHHECELEALP